MGIKMILVKPCIGGFDSQVLCRLAMGERGYGHPTGYIAYILSSRDGAV